MDFLKKLSSQLREDTMHTSLILLGSVSGIFGALICLIAGLTRITGFYYLAGYQATTVFNAGMALMIFACLLKLNTLSKQGQGK